MKKIYRSKKDRKLAGILGGFGELYGVDSTLLRLIYSFLVVFTGIVPFVVLYFIAWMIIPEKPHEAV